MKNLNTASKISLGNMIFSRLEDVEWTSNKYSKSYHRKFGDYREVSNRRVAISKPDRRAKNGERQLAIVDFESWRGDILIRAIDQSGLFQLPATDAPLSIRLNKWYGAKIIRSINGVKIYSRTLLGEHIDYCAFLNGVTFHHESIRECLKGLRGKIDAKIIAKNHPINYKLCIKLGFCKIGIRQFCRIFNLDINASYSPAEFEAFISANAEKSKPYQNEICAIRKSLGI